MEVRTCFTVAAMAAFLVLIAHAAPAAQLFKEDFEDVNFASRGWYEVTGGTLSSAEHAPGSTKSLQMRFRAGDQTPYGGNPQRIQFTATDSIYVSYWVKYSANWQGQLVPYDHHEFYLLTNLDDRYSGLAWTRLTAYIEQNHGKPVLTIQDGKNINTSYIGQNIVSLTENRSVAGCNGDSDGYGNGDCYNSGNWYNGKDWPASTVCFSDTPGANYKGDWHHVEAFFKMNSIVNGKAAKDGQIMYWYDGRAVISHTNVVLRTGANASMKFNQFIIAPWMGEGSGVDQTFWVDNLSAHTARPTTDTADTVRPNPPVGVTARVQ